VLLADVLLLLADALLLAEVLLLLADVLPLAAGDPVADPDPAAAPPLPPGTSVTTLCSPCAHAIVVRANTQPIQRGRPTEVRVCREVELTPRTPFIAALERIAGSLQAGGRHSIESRAACR
jgi:hypothetical protein